MRKKKKRRGRKDKRILLAVLAIGVVVILAAALYQFTHQGQQSEPEHKEAREYFEISDIVPVGDLKENGSVLALNMLAFNITAIGGDATYVTVGYGMDGMPTVDPPQGDLGNMTKGETVGVGLMFSFPLHITLEEEGFPIRIPVFCEEAWGDITIYLPRESPYYTEL